MKSACQGYQEALAKARCAWREGNFDVYNVAEAPAFSELDWARKIAAASGWEGEFVILPKEHAPPHLAPPGNVAQHWEADSRRIRQELGYEDVVPLDDAIRRTIDWERAYPPGEFSPHQFDYAAEDAALSYCARAAPLSPAGD